MRRSILPLVGMLIFASLLSYAQSAKPKLSLDDFFNSVSFSSVKVSPDGSSVIIEVEKADWDQQIFRKELWLYREASGGSSPKLSSSSHNQATTPPRNGRPTVNGSPSSRNAKGEIRKTTTQETPNKEAELQRERKPTIRAKTSRSSS